jgi:hypothetical protein
MQSTEHKHWVDNKTNRQRYAFNLQVGQKAFKANQFVINFEEHINHSTNKDTMEKLITLMTQSPATQSFDGNQCNRSPLAEARRVYVNIYM